MSNLIETKEQKKTIKKTISLGGYEVVETIVNKELGNSQNTNITEELKYRRFVFVICVIAAFTIAMIMILIDVSEKINLDTVLDCIVNLLLNLVIFLVFLLIILSFIFLNNK